MYLKSLMGKRTQIKSHPDAEREDQQLPFPALLLASMNFIVLLIPAISTLMANGFNPSLFLTGRRMGQAGKDPPVWALEPAPGWDGLTCRRGTHSHPFDGLDGSPFLDRNMHQILDEFHPISWN
ncbi:hypothetical protein DFH08DRAFT_812014 [Mycena albidolilacea]|uniref:Uncharacterized protein n=1 Tax=Mycena albidolilacea TaxID=1033008 RepID=A0AAD7ENL3_9AGAR|nr:hypothetical protein DFH08DRAFT_812014 [Mycena albidolilacea]